MMFIPHYSRDSHHVLITALSQQFYCPHGFSVLRLWRGKLQVLNTMFFCLFSASTSSWPPVYLVLRLPCLWHYRLSPLPKAPALTSCLCMCTSSLSGMEPVFTSTGCEKSQAQHCRRRFSIRHRRLQTRATMPVLHCRNRCAIPHTCRRIEAIDERFH